jgi:hypothetical protein
MARCQRIANRRVIPAEERTMYDPKYPPRCEVRIDTGYVVAPPFFRGTPAECAAHAARALARREAAIADRFGDPGVRAYSIECVVDPYPRPGMGDSTRRLLGMPLPEYFRVC